MKSVCPCDNHGPFLAVNPPGLPRIEVRRGDWTSIRRALLTGSDIETALCDWRPGSSGDLGTMIAEWWATLGDVLEFYDDLIANEAFLGTATRRESAARLISLLGYRPRPALAATATLAGLIKGREPVTLPAGFAFESIPAAGDKAQTFELGSEAKLVPGNLVPARAPATLTAPETGKLLVEGKPRSIKVGDVLRLTSGSAYYALTLTGMTPADGSPPRTWLSYSSDRDIGNPRAADCRLERPTLALPLWTANGSAVMPSGLHLAAMTRAIHAGDNILVTQPGTNALHEVTGVEDVVWYLNPSDPSHPEVSPGPTGLAVPHTFLDFSHGGKKFEIEVFGKFFDWNAAEMIVNAGWVEVAPLLDQPPAAWSGSPSALEAIAPALFGEAVAVPALLSDANGLGLPVALTADANSASAAATVDSDYSGGAALASPLDVLTGLLPVTRGKTVAREVLGVGDARVPGQSFTLKKDPVTYLRSGAGYASTVIVRVNGVPWTEVASFYGQPADASVFTLSENEDGKTNVSFGDGINGRRLPSGAEISATYRYGAGAKAPVAGKLTRIPTPYPGLAKVLNPVEAGGGADAEATGSIRRFAPRSVLTLGRAVSVADFQAIAAAAVAPARVNTIWAWDEVRQRAAVTIYVEGPPATRAAVKKAVEAAGDPHRPVVVEAATPLPFTLSLTILVAPGFEADPIAAAAKEAMIGDEGLVSADRLNIGQPLFVSALSAELVPIPGVLTIGPVEITVGGVVQTETLLRIGDDQWFDLEPEDLHLTIEMADG